MYFFSFQRYIDLYIILNCATVWKQRLGCNSEDPLNYELPRVLTRLSLLVHCNRQLDLLFSNIITRALDYDVFHSLPYKAVFFNIFVKILFKNQRYGSFTNYSR